MQPLRFQPILKRIRWGGRRLGNVLNKSIGSDNDYAESWEIADHGADQSIVSDGPFAGQSLNQLVKRYQRAIFGATDQFDQFPLLVNFSTRMIDCPCKCTRTIVWRERSIHAKTASPKRGSSLRQIIPVDSTRASNRELMTSRYELS